MKTTLISRILLVLFFNTTLVYSQDTVKPCTITYIANEGFLIETINSKVLIDALFGGIRGNWCDQPEDSVSNLILKGIPPFDSIDLVLVSHKHSDHFNEQMAITFLTNNQSTVLMCPEQVNEVLKKNSGYFDVADRIRYLESDKQFDTLLAVNKINIRVLRFNHGSFYETDSVTGEKYDLHRDVENFGYIIDADSFSMFHSGDGSFLDKSHFESYHFGDLDFDIVFLDRTFLMKEGQEILNSLIHTKNLIFMHIEPGRGEYYTSIIKDVPGFFVFTKKMEKKQFFK